jgi:hypothetical protein
MLKKITLLLVVIAAFAVPAAAQARDPVVTNFLGEASEYVTLDGIGVKTSTPSGPVRCTATTARVDFSENANATALGSGSGTAVGDRSIPTRSGPCVLAPLGIPFDFTELAVTSLDLGSGKGSITLHETFDFTHPVLGSVTCSFLATAEVTYTAKSDRIALSNGALTETETQSIPPCFSTGVISGEFTITDEFRDLAVLD